MSYGVFQQYLTDMAAELPSCPLPLAVQHLKNAMTEFLRKTRIWQDEQVFTSVSSEEFTLVPPTGSVIERIESVWFSYDSGTNWQEFNDRYYTFEPTQTLAIEYLRNTDTSNLQVKAVFSLTPEKPVDEDEPCPEWIQSRYWDAFVFGAKSSLMLLPKYPFSNPAMGAYYRTKFKKECARAIREAKLRYSNTSNRLGA